MKNLGTYDEMKELYDINKLEEFVYDSYYISGFETYKDEGKIDESGIKKYVYYASKSTIEYSSKWHESRLEAIKSLILNIAKDDILNFKTMHTPIPKDEKDDLEYDLIVNKLSNIFNKDNDILSDLIKGNDNE